MAISIFLIIGAYVQTNKTHFEKPNSTELLLLKFLPLDYYHSHLLAATSDFTFFHPCILGPHTLFKPCCFCIDITPFCNCIFIYGYYITAVTIVIERLQSLLFNSPFSLFFYFNTFQKYCHTVTQGI